MIDMEQIYFTWNLFSTPIVILVLGIYIKRLLAKGDEAQTLRYDGIQKQFMAIEKKVDSYCNGNAKDHDELWQSIRAHGHKGLDGEDNEVVIHRTK